MKLWSVGIEKREAEFEKRKIALMQAVIGERSFGPGSLMGTNDDMFNIIFASKAESLDDLLMKIRGGVKAAGAEDTVVYGCELPRDTDWAEFAGMLGVDADALESMAGVVYDKKPEAENTAGRIALEASVEGIDEAIKMLKILDAQLQGVTRQAERIGAAIEGLQLKLENRIATLAKPDR